MHADITLTLNAHDRDISGVVALRGALWTWETTIFGGVLRAADLDIDNENADTHDYALQVKDSKGVSLGDSTWGNLTAALAKINAWIDSSPASTNILEPAVIIDVTQSGGITNVSPTVFNTAILNA
jgi:hypothetical protein